MVKEQNEDCCDVSECNPVCCKVESIVSVDERGQMVLPKELRAKANIKPGDKLALTYWEKNGEIYCIALIKTDDLAGMVKDMLGPVMSTVNSTNEKKGGEEKRRTKS